MPASDFHRICSRMNTFTKKPDENLNNLLRLLLYSKPFESEETKYGKSMEPHAIQKFISKNKRLHKNLNVSESGLVLMVENPFIGASPDSNVDCFCCGSGLLELKCSSSIKREKSSHENLSFLTLGENDKVTLSKTIHFFTKYNDKWLSLKKIIVVSYLYTLWSLSGKNYTQSRNLEKYSSNIGTVLEQISTT